MFFSNSHQDDAAGAVDDLRGLITQQEYEFQRLFADLQLSVIAMDEIVATRKITHNDVDPLVFATINLKYELRNAREIVADTVRNLQQLQIELAQLEPND